MRQDERQRRDLHVERGLVVGKFMPLHLGHVGLIEFARRNCAHLTVVVCSLPNESIPGELRVKWIHEMLDVLVYHVEEDLPQDDSPEASRVWAEYLKRFGRFDYVFTSETYGDTLAQYMGAKHISFDPKRELVHISGTDIRRHPLRWWDWIAPVARPYFVKRLVLYGPESTGKTTLARQLAQHFQTLWVPEYARDYIDRHNTFGPGEVEAFAFRQREYEDTLVRHANRILLCDTDPLTSMIYYQEYFGSVGSSFVRFVEEENPYEMYLFCETDLPWMPDPQRDLGHKREEMRKIFLNELTKRGRPFQVVHGRNEDRFYNAMRVVQAVIDLN